MLVGTYKSTTGKNFVMWHCKQAFKEGYDCVNSVCSLCKMTHDKSDHECGVCGQKLSTYKAEDDQRMMSRNGKIWAVPGPEKGSICCIEL